jgi:hypothetical protein
MMVLNSELLFVCLHCCCGVDTIPRPDDEDIKSQFQAIGKELHDQRKFTNVSTFSLQCMVCGMGLVGQEDAVSHAMSTGHQNFGQF